MDVAKELIAILGGTAMAVAALAWLARSIVIHFLSKDLDCHKAALSAKYATEIEKLKAELTKQTVEHEIKYRRVDEKVAEYLDGTYRRLLRLFESVSSYVHMCEWPSEPSRAEKLVITNDANKVFRDYFLENRVYIPPRLYERIREVADKLTDITRGFSIGQFETEGKEIHGIEEIGYWLDALDAVKEEADPLYTALVAAIQKRVGVRDEEPETPMISSLDQAGR